jgi:hypothetical protein
MRYKFNETYELSKQKETRKLYMAVKKINKGYQPQTRRRDKDEILMANPTEVKTRWTEYFQEQLGKPEDDNEDEELKAHEKIEYVESRTHSNRGELVEAPTSE